jgi:predicted TIM-barrel fold metal-dependent hydrolase
VTAPGPCIEKDSTKAARLARQLNDYVAKLRDDDPEGYGLFGSVPSLLDTEACLKEIAYMFDVLHADGVTLFTRYGSDNHYLGHPDFKPIWAELSRRKAVVFIHPTHPVDTNLINKSMPQPMFDYPHETGRTAMDLIVNNTLRSYPDCKIILSHAGGTLPYLIYRPAGLLPHTPMSIGKSTEEIVEEARLFYFDTAISANPITLQALLTLAKPGHVMFGTDFPNAPTPSIEYFTKNLGEFGMDEKTRKEVYYEGALELFPRLKAYYR